MVLKGGEKITKVRNEPCEQLGGFDQGYSTLVLSIVNAPHELLMPRIEVRRIAPWEGALRLDLIVWD